MEVIDEDLVVPDEGVCRWNRPFPWFHAANLFFGEGHAILVDEWPKGEVR